MGREALEKERSGREVTRGEQYAILVQINTVIKNIKKFLRVLVQAQKTNDSCSDIFLEGSRGVPTRDSRMPSCS
jgi:hypothetical protein